MLHFQYSVSQEIQVTNLLLDDAAIPRLSQSLVCYCDAYCCLKFGYTALRG